MNDSIEIRPATEADTESIYQLCVPFVDSGQLLKRNPEEIRMLVSNGFVAIRGETETVGFAAVEIYSRKLAEILCLAVSPDCQGQGVGKRLVRQCIRFANQHDVVELMAISSSDHFLKNCGFDYTLPDQKRALFINPDTIDSTEMSE